MNWKAAIICFTLIYAPLAGAAEIYKWKDADGQIRYSDTPPPGKTPYKNIAKKKPVAGNGDEGEGAGTSSGGVAPVLAEKTAGDKDIDARRKQAAAEELKKKELDKQDTKKIRDENCTIARKNLTNYNIGGRIYKVDDKGERVYLDDSEIVAGQEKAQKDVEQWCSEQ